MSHLNLAWAGVKKPHCRNCLRTTLLRLREIQSQVQTEPDFTSLWNKTQSTSAFEWQDIHRRSLINLAIKVYKPDSQQDLVPLVHDGDHFYIIIFDPERISNG